MVETDDLFSSSTRALLEVAGVTDVRRHREKVDERIVELECEIWEMKSSHNALTTTYRLPSEILSSIFLSLSLMDSTDLDQPIYRRVSWLRATFVCRRWRFVALGYAALWTTPPLDEPELAKIMISRSQGAPLSIHYGAPELWRRGSQFPILYKVLSKLDRLRSVKLEAVRYYEDLDFLSLLSHWTDATLPVLETLHLSHSSEHHNSPLPVRFLQGGAPQLRHLTLLHCGNTWDQAPLFPSITHLSLEGPRKAPSESNNSRPPTVAKLVDSLRHLPHLQHLDLAYCLPLATTAPHIAPARLAALRSLNLSDTAATLESFFRVVQLPKIARMGFCITECWALDRMTLKGMFDTIKASIAIEGGDVSCSILGEAQQLHIQDKKSNVASGTSTSFDFWFRDIVGLPDLTFAFDTVWRETRNIAPAIFDSFKVAAMLSLKLGYLSVAREDVDFEELFAYMPKVEVITVRHVAIFEDLLKTLKGESSSTSVLNAPFTSNPKEIIHSPARCLVPALSTFSCESLQFHWESEEKYGRDLLIDVMKDSLQAHPTMKLTIDDCADFNEYDYKAIREGVPGLDFRWDGRVFRW
ncbi:hypothetical protein D9611_002778 [Ephemerocybe angulata]|uniref:F-box domain-containing protein n=1 Tax=Ephemerocybe angulata TaxID=980116 RepID=A0A8H5C118_9AGAR|nr:hypothetical protein D9611_002778 [Tulosesus angulatus]